jgi:hypothetical protein
MNDSIKTGIGLTLGTGIPAVMFFTNTAPPLFPYVALITSALATYFSIALLSKPAASAKRIRLSYRTFITAIVGMIVYVLLWQGTTVKIDETETTRIQAGFGMAEWSLLPHARPAGYNTMKSALLYEGASQDNAHLIWKSWTISLASGLLMLVYFVTFTAWASAFCLLRRAWIAQT